MFPHFFIHEKEKDSYVLASLINNKVVTLRQEQLSRLIREF